MAECDLIQSEQGKSAPRVTNGPPSYSLEGFMPMAEPGQARQVGRLGLAFRLVRSNDFGQLGSDQAIEVLAPAGIPDWPTLLIAAATGWPDSRGFPPSFHAAANARPSARR